jgi:HEAT repeat protein
VGVTALLISLLGCANKTMADDTKPKGASMQERVNQAFAALRRGDATASAELPTLGPAVLPAVARYLDDPSEDVRRQVVAISAAVKGDAAVSLLLKALGDTSSDIRERAALGLYDGVSPAAFAGHKEAGPALRAAVKQGPTAAAVLLLGYVPGKETTQLLAPLEREEKVKVKLHAWDPVVSLALPALMAASRVGSRQAREALLSRLSAGPTEEVQFALLALPIVDAPEVIQSLASALHDEHEISGGVPSGAAPRRRVCDLAVDSLVERLSLKPSFARNGAKRYELAQRQEVERLIRGSIP